MIKEETIIFFIFLLLSSGVGQTYWTTTIFITSDNIINDNGDDKMLNSIKNYLEELSNKQIKVMVDNKLPNPKKASRRIKVVQMYVLTPQLSIPETF